MIWLALLACDFGFADPSREYAEPLPSSGDYPIVVHEPTGFGVLDQAPLSKDPEREIAPNTACTACHGPTSEQTWESDPDEDWHGLEVSHGELACAACHDPQDLSKLRMADGTQLELPRAVELCSQCHGPQRRDFDHGAHGGASGYWDRSQGAQVRNTCSDCHLPHDPAFGSTTAVFPPRDRYLHQAAR